MRTAHGLRLMTLHAEERYTNAQIDDYASLPCAFRWPAAASSPPLPIFAIEPDRLRGTAGFGFWNDPFLMTGWRMPAPPSVAWFFFASPPSDMPWRLPYQDRAGGGRIDATQLAPGAGQRTTGPAEVCCVGGGGASHGRPFSAIWG